MSAWWENRKSRIGLSPIAKEPPPFGNGRPWWTSPPIAAPMPEHIEYVAEFARRIQMLHGTEGNAMRKHVADWMRVARRLLHEDMQTPHRPDLQTTDGLLVACYHEVMRAKSLIHELGGEVPQSLRELSDALNGRTAKIRRERAVAPVRIRRRA